MIGQFFFREQGQVPSVAALLLASHSWLFLRVRSNFGWVCIFSRLAPPFVFIIMRSTLACGRR